MRAVLTFDDVNGIVQLTSFFEDGWHKESGAHQAAQIAIKLLDDVMVREGEGQAVEVSGEAAAWLKEQIVVPPNLETILSGKTQ